MTIEDQITDLWATGKKAPYALFEVKHFIDGYPILVEAVAGDAQPVIERGDIISAELAERIAKQVYSENDPALLSIVDTGDTNVE